MLANQPVDYWLWSMRQDLFTFNTMSNSETSFQAEPRLDLTVSRLITSTRLVSITMSLMSYCQTISQKAGVVSSPGPCGLQNILKFYTTCACSSRFAVCGLRFFRHIRAKMTCISLITKLTCLQAKTNIYIYIYIYYQFFQANTNI